MHDIFLSYSTQDRERLMPLVAALEQRGWSVFWDHKSVPVGKHWQQMIGNAIRESACVVVVWSEHSIQSEWVLEEALEGKRRGVLLPISFDKTLPPFGFGLHQAADFNAWDGKTSHAAFEALAQEIRTHLHKRGGVSQRPVQVAEQPQSLRSVATTVPVRYIIHNDGTVTDTKTKLMWKRCSEGQSRADCSGEAGKYTWNDAMSKFGKGVSFAGYNDWRMPTIDELRTLVDKSQSPTIDLQAFPNTQPTWFWSSSTVANDGDGAWVVVFDDGGDGWDFKDDGSQVRLVRSGQ